MVNGCRGTGVMVEADAKLRKARFHHLVVLINYLLRRLSFLGCLDGDGHAVLVRPTDIGYISPLRAKVAHVDVGWNITAGQVADV